MFTVLHTLSLISSLTITSEMVFSLLLIFQVALGLISLPSSFLLLISIDWSAVVALRHHTITTSINVISSFFGIISTFNKIGIYTLELILHIGRHNIIIVG